MKLLTLYSATNNMLLWCPINLRVIYKELDRGIPYANKDYPYANDRKCPAYMDDFSFRY